MVVEHLFMHWTFIKHKICRLATVEILFNSLHIAVGLLPLSCCTTCFVLCGTKVFYTSHFISSLDAAILVSVALSFRVFFLVFF